ncbi:MAG: hypothetical protein FWG30_11610 [Eubacteriaceae bacterium]|nr:hypothetical protein [Eubacteriaceae bacterium]
MAKKPVRVLAIAMLALTILAITAETASAANPYRYNLVYQGGKWLVRQIWVSGKLKVLGAFKTIAGARAFMHRLMFGM